MNFPYTIKNKEEDMKNFFYFATIVGLMSLGACSSPSQSTSKVEAVRGPASVGSSQQSKLWGKPISLNELDFLEELENSPSQKY